MCFATCIVGFYLIFYGDQNTNFKFVCNFLNSDLSPGKEAVGLPARYGAEQGGEGASLIINLVLDILAPEGFLSVFTYCSS